MMNRAKEMIDNFIEQKVVEVTRDDKYVKGEYGRSESYRWFDDKYETYIYFSVSRRRIENGQENEKED